MSESEIVDAEVEEDVSNLPAVRASQAIITRDEISVEEIVAQREKIVQVMDAVMKRDIHYGLIPGVNKPSLFKPGAETLCVALRLAPHYVSEKIWHEDGHLTVSVVCTLKHIPTSLEIATGEGLCSTKESRYAYRQGERVCPQCKGAYIIKGKAEYGGGWICFKKKGGCGAKFEDGDPVIESQEIGRIPNPELADTYNCVTPETRILTHDLRWISAGELATGDTIVGVAEDYNDSAGGRYSRPYAEGVATIGPRFEDDLYEVTAEDGRTVRCNGEHRWLVNESGIGGTEWVSTAEIYENLSNRPTGRPRVWRISSVCSPWETNETKEAGYLAGLLDADGTLGVGNHSREVGYHSVAVQFAQQEGLVLDRFLAEAEKLDFQFAITPHGGGEGTKPVSQATLRGGFFAQMLLLGTLRPPRLLDRWLNLVDLSRRRLESRRQKITKVEKVGRGELVRIGTTCHTYVAEGFLCHNTVLKMGDKRALTAAVLNGTAASDVFTMDVEDTAGGNLDPEPISQTPEVRIEGPEPLRRPTSWAKVTEMVSHYDEKTHDDFMLFAASCRRLLYPGATDSTSLSKEEKAELLRIAGGAALALRNAVDPALFPPPSVEDIRKAWASVLEGQELAIPEDAAGGTANEPE